MESWLILIFICFIIVMLWHMGNRVGMTAKDWVKFVLGDRCRFTLREFYHKALRTNWTFVYILFIVVSVIIIGGYAHE